VLVVPCITNPIFGTTMVVRLERSPSDLLSDVAQLLVRDRDNASTSCGRRVEPHRHPRLARPRSRHERDRPFFGNQQLGFVVRDLELIPDAVTGEVHAVDAVREAAG
jgi:hypothetical protein